MSLSFIKGRFVTANKIYIHIIWFHLLQLKCSISMTEIDQDVFGDSDSDQSFHAFMAQELNKSVQREDISVKEYSSESENDGNSEEENNEEMDDEAELLEAGGNVQRQPEGSFG